MGAWEEAVSAWTTTIEMFVQTRPIWHLELSNALAKVGNLEDAERERARALSSGQQTSGNLRRLAGRASSLGDWELAAHAYRRAAEFDDDPDALERAAAACFEGGELDETVATYQQIIDQVPVASPNTYAGLANALRKRGELEQAELVASTGLAIHPGAPALLGARGWIATNARAWKHAADRWTLAIKARPDGSPPRWFFSYGEALEHLGQFDDAVNAYEKALRALQTIDKPWAHWAILEWDFRRSYCLARCSDAPSEDPALRVETVSNASADREAIRDHDRFAADVTHLGLRIHGTTLSDPGDGSVDVLVDGTPIKQVDLDSDGSRQRFTFTIRHSALARFPPQFDVSVTAGSRLLAADEDSTAIRVSVPNGDSTLFDRLATTHLFTKKGALVDQHHADTSPERLLGAYATLREFFADHLGIDLFLMYGTLLGCHRDGRFIPGDDDLDVGYVTTCGDPARVKSEALATVQVMIAAGFDVTTRHGGGLFKVWIGEIDVDVYPIWFRDGRAWGYDAVLARPDDFVPASTRDFLGADVLVPRHPEILLAGTYGPGWSEPNPGFRHYRSKSVMNMIQRASLTPSEARQVLTANAAARSEHPHMGTFGIHNGGPN